MLDVDGVLTNGSMLLLDNGEHLRTVSVKDAQAIEIAVKDRYKVALVCEGGSEALKKYYGSVGVTEFYFGEANKQSAYERFILNHGISALETAFVGDDLGDWQPMFSAGFAACPADAADEIRKIAHYVSPMKGGEGVVREIISMIMKANGHWPEMGLRDHIH